MAKKAKKTKKVTVKKTEKHWSVRALDSFVADHPEFFDLTTLGTDPQYLKNRLSIAFLAGVDAFAVEFNKTNGKPG